MPVRRDFYKIFRNLELRYSGGYRAAATAGRAVAGTWCEIVLMSRHSRWPTYSSYSCVSDPASRIVDRAGTGRRGSREPAGRGAGGHFSAAPRNLRQQLSRAAKALEEERNSEAVDLLGQLLASPEVASDSTEGGADQDYFVAESEADGTQTSLKSQAQQMLGAMNDQGRELYELKFGPMRGRCWSRR